MFKAYKIRLMEGVGPIYALEMAARLGIVGAQQSATLQLCRKEQ